MSSPREVRHVILVAAGVLGILGFCLWSDRPVSDEGAPPKWVVAGVTFCRVEGGAVSVGARRFPGTPVDTLRISEGWLMVHEFRVADFCRWLNATQLNRGFEHPQVLQREGVWFPEEGEAVRPVGSVGAEMAEEIAVWVGDEAGLAWQGRLPREVEWMAAARAGVAGTPYPWGYESPNAERAVFARERVAPVSSRPANAWGFTDMSGNVWEWCRDSLRDDAVWLKGGSYAERDPTYLDLARRVEVADGYAGSDAGFRVWLEPAGNR